MSKLASAKTFGGVGSILMLVAPLIPAIGTALALAGLVLVFVAVKYISDEIKDQEVFKNFLISFIFSVVAFIIAGVLLVAGIFGSLVNIANPVSALATFIGSLILAFIALWIVLILSAVFLRRSYNSISVKTKVEMFETTATFYLIGSVLIIVLIGLIILFIAMVLQIVAFFSLPEALETPTQEIQK
ncbi:MAG: DUF996 domain-containing protein [Archaeoglobaceae archaeon]|nr:DUF996 domain-containing protein [Archaeoglobales archaeon]MDI9642624.1 DUF996 domain-containing protein [Archaeoglobales archaeon]